MEKISKKKGAQHFIKSFVRKKYTYSKYNVSSLQLKTTSFCLKISRHFGCFLPYSVTDWSFTYNSVSI